MWSMRTGSCLGSVFLGEQGEAASTCFTELHPQSQQYCMSLLEGCDKKLRSPGWRWLNNPPASYSESRKQLDHCFEPWQPAKEGVMHILVSFSVLPSASSWFSFSLGRLSTAWTVFSSLSTSWTNSEVRLSSIRVMFWVTFVGRKNMALIPSVRGSWAICKARNKREIRESHINNKQFYPSCTRQRPDSQAGISTFSVNIWSFSLIAFIWHDASWHFWLFPKALSILAVLSCYGSALSPAESCSITLGNSHWNTFELMCQGKIGWKR